jgi:hypothetical protein
VDAEVNAHCLMSFPDGLRSHEVNHKLVRGQVAS